MPAKRTPQRVIPEPTRPLMSHGRALWDVVHSAGDVRGNVEPLLMTCERFDERTRLRIEIQNHTAADRFKEANDVRASLRALEAMLNDDFERLGLRTILPVVSVAPDSWMTNVAQLRS